MPILPDAVASSLGPEAAIEPSARVTDLLLQLRTRILQATTAEVTLRSKLLLEQLRRLAHFTARDLAPAGASRLEDMRATLAPLERACGRDVSSLELLACRLVCAELSRRPPPVGRRARGVDLGARLEEVRLDVRTLVDWARGDLWTSVARKAVLEASRTAVSLEAEGNRVLPALEQELDGLRRTPRRPDALTRVAEEVALGELKRLFTQIRVVPTPLSEGDTAGENLPSAVRTFRRRGLCSAHRRLLRLAHPAGRPEDLDRASPELQRTAPQAGLAGA